MLIQVILLAGALVLLFVFIRNSHTVRAQAFKRIAFILFLLMSCDAVLRPNDTNWAAKKVGVGRGADLVLYLLVVAFAFFALNTFLRFRNLERRFTDLVRAVAINGASTPDARGTTALPAAPGAVEAVVAEAVEDTDGSGDPDEAGFAGLAGEAVAVGGASVPQQARRNP